jgi:putative FmdB family regulatory protein
MEVLDMPIYEYRCESCGREFEEWQKFSDPPVERCGQCGGATRRLISQSTFVLKGTGWYVTDYGRSSSASSRKTSAKKETTTETKSSDSVSTTDS